MTLHILTYGAMRGCGLNSLVDCISDKICDIRERSVTISSEFWTTNIHSLGLHDIREWVILWRLILRSLGCASNSTVYWRKLTPLMIDLTVQTNKFIQILNHPCVQNHNMFKCKCVRWYCQTMVMIVPTNTTTCTFMDLITWFLQGPSLFETVFRTWVTYDQSRVQHCMGGGSSTICNS